MRSRSEAMKPKEPPLKDKRDILVTKMKRRHENKETQDFESMCNTAEKISRSLQQRENFTFLSEVVCCLKC